MPRPTLSDRVRFFTMTDVARELELTIAQVERRLEQEILPPPTVVRRSGLRLFNRAWLDAARAQLQRKESIEP